MKIPDSIRPLVDTLSELPGIGPRQAIRISFHLMGRGSSFIETMSRSISTLSKFSPCVNCFYPHDSAGNMCPICSDESRDRGLIAVIEKETDLISIESSGEFRGNYLVVSDIKKIGALDTIHKLRVASLKERIAKTPKGKVNEIIIAISPTTAGDINADIIAAELSPVAEKITRLGRGMPTGGEIEFADAETLGAAINGRK